MQLRSSLMRRGHCLDMRRRRLDERHVDIGDSLVQKGCLPGDMEEQMRLFREALAIFRERKGDRHPKAAVCLNCIGELL